VEALQEGLLISPWVGERFTEDVGPDVSRCSLVAGCRELLRSGSLTCKPLHSALRRRDGGCREPGRDPVGPGSTVGAAAIVNAVKCQVAAGLTARGKPPLVLSSSVFSGDASAAKFDASYDDYRRRVRRVYGD